MNGKISNFVKVCYGAGDVGCAIFIVSSNMFLLFFMTDVLGIDPMISGTVIFSAKLWDVFSDPIMGGISDKTNTRIGRRRPYLLFASIPFGIGFYYLFQSPEIVSQEMQIYYSGGIFILCCTLFTIFSVPYSGMIAEMSADYNERTSITSSRMIGASIGTLLAGGIVMPLVKIGGEGESGFKFMSLVIGVLISIFCMICFLGTRKAPFVVGERKTMSLKRQFLIVLKNRSFLFLLSTYFLQSVAVGILMSGLVYFLKYSLGMPESSTGTIFPIMFITAIVFIPIWSKIARKVGKIRAYKGGIIFLALILLSLCFATSQYPVVFYGQVFLLGVGFSCFQILPWSMLPDTVEIDEMNSGMRREGVFSGIWTASQKIAFGVSPGIVGLTLSISGYSHGQAHSPSVSTGMKVIFCVVTSILFLVSFLPLNKYDITEEKFIKIVGKLRQKT